MANKKKSEPKIKVDTPSNDGLKVDESASANFVEGLINTFQDKGALLEAQRIVDAKDKTAEIDLIMHDEEHSDAYKGTKNLK